MPDERIDRSKALQRRFFDFAADIILSCRGLRASQETWVIRSQLIRSATSLVANYRAAARAQSPRAFVAKVSIALEEADESLMWLRLLVRIGLMEQQKAQPLLAEAEVAVRILAASRRTVRERMRAR